MWAGKTNKWWAAALLLATGRLLQAATFTWDGGSATTNNWTDPINWSTNIVPANDGSADIIFAGGIRPGPIVDTPFSILSLSFTGASGNFSVGGANTITLGAGGILQPVVPVQTIAAPILLGAPQTWTASGGGLTVTGSVNTNANTLTVSGGSFPSISGAISGGGGLIKDGTGTLSLFGTAANTYTGTTTIAGGTLALNKTATNGAVLGPIVIGDGVGSDILRLDNNNQINDSSTITTNGGVLDLNGFSETITGLNMTGGSIGGAGASTLILSGPGITTNASSSAAFFNSGILNFSGGVKTITVADGGAVNDFEFFAAINSAPGGIIKAGPGTMRFGGGANNGYTTPTTVNEGTLVLNRSVTAINGPLIIGDGAGLDIVRLDNIGQINNTSALTINSSGLLDLNGNFQAFTSAITLNAGVIATGTGGTLRLAGSLTSLASSTTATISGAGTIDLFGFVRTFTVNDGPVGDDLEISPTISNGNVTKSGTGTLVFSGNAANTYGTTFVTAGTLVLRKNSGTVAIPAQLAIGDSLGPNNGDVVRLESNEQISDSSVVQINTPGLLDINGRTETIAAVTFSGGAINLNNGSLSILGDLSTSPSTPSSINGPGILDLGSAARTYNIADTVLPVDMDITGSVNDGTLIKTGSGTLQLSGGASNLNPTVNQGILLLNKPAAAAELSGTVVVGDNIGLSGSDILRYAASNQIANNAATSITVNSTGLLDLTGFSDTISNITLAGGTISTGAGTLTISGTFTQNDGTFNGSLLNQGTYNFNGGSINGTLTNEGVVNLNANLSVGTLENRAHMSVGIGRTLAVGGTLRNIGTFSLDGGTLTGAGNVINDFGGEMFARGTISANFTNNGTLQTTGLLTLGGGSNANFGAININSAQSLVVSGLNNFGTITLFSGALGGSVMNNGQIQGGGGISANLSSSGLIFANGASPLVISNLATNGAAGELRIADGSTMNLINQVQSDGTINLQGQNATLNGAQINNNGTIIGRGRISNTVSNSGVVRAEGGLLNFAGSFTNAIPGSIQVPAGATALFSLGLAGNGGTISLSGGTLSTNNIPLNNTGVISGFGNISTASPVGGAGLTNNGSITFTGGFTTINGSVTNSAGHQIRVAYNPALFTNNVINNGIFKNTSTTITFAGTYTENGTFISDPADNYFSDVNIGPAGAWVGGVGDRFFVSGDFLNQSTSPAWDTRDAELHLLPGGQRLQVSGRDLGVTFDGYEDNFAWGTLSLSAGRSLTLLDADQTPGGAVYVGHLDLQGGIDQISNITGNGMTLYYHLGDPNNAYLGGKSYQLAGGGSIRPVPEPAGILLGLIAAPLMFARRAHRRRRA